MNNTKTPGPRSLDDYLGCAGLDHEGGIDPMTGMKTPPTWQPLEENDTNFGEKVVERFKRFRATIVKNGLLETWRGNYRQYFNGPVSATKGSGWGFSSSFDIAGENGEILNVRVSEPRTLITRMANLACSKPVALRCVAKSATPDSLEAAQIAESVLKRDFDPTEGGQLTREGVEMALAVTCAFLDDEWDKFAGEAYVPTDDGGMYYSGKPKTSVRMPDEVCFDITKRTWKDVLDCIVLQRGNRYMLASQFPDLADEILSQPSLTDSEFKSFRYEDEDTDDIVVFRYMHKAGNKTFLPEGRLALVLENGTVLRDGSNPYALVDPERLGLFPITAGSSLGSVYGYATMNDLSPLAQWLNLMATMCATLIVGYGAPNLTGPIMQGVDVQAMIGGGRYFGVPGGQGDVKPLNLLDESAVNSLLEAMKFVIDLGEKHSGMSGLVREPGDGDSGKKVVAMQSMAVQFMSALQQSIIAVSKARGNYLIRMRQRFSTMEEVAELAAGVGSSQQVVSYKASEKFPLVAGVEAEPVDPLSWTFEGRSMRAQEMMQLGAFNDPKTGMPRPTAAYDYAIFVKTGRDEPLYKRQLATGNLIQRENQLIMKGEMDVTVLEDDEHEVHLADHTMNDADPSARKPDSPQFRANQEHKARHKLFMMGITPMQGINPETGQPFPPAYVQFQMAEQQRAAEEQAMMAQQAAMQQQGQGKPNGGSSPQQGQGAPPSPPPQGGAPAQPRTAEMAMQQAAMGQAV